MIEQTFCILDWAIKMKHTASDSSYNILGSKSVLSVGVIIALYFPQLLSAYVFLRISGVGWRRGVSNLKNITNHNPLGRNLRGVDFIK
jgi:hypothetical protein